MSLDGGRRGEGRGGEGGREGDSEEGREGRGRRDDCYTYSNRPFPPTFATQRERERLRYWVGFLASYLHHLKTAFGTVGNCRLRSH